MSRKGRVFKYGDNVNTDVIFPGKYTYTVSEPEEMAKYAMEDLDPDFVKTVKDGDIVVGGLNFGCGSSREQAAVCLKYCGIYAIVAKTFSRIYFRNAINAGLAAITCPEAVDAIENGETIEIDFEKGTINCSKGTFNFPALPPSVLGILKDGGLIPHTRKVLKLD